MVVDNGINMEIPLVMTNSLLLNMDPNISNLITLRITPQMTTATVTTGEIAELRIQGWTHTHTDAHKFKCMYVVQCSVVEYKVG